MKSPSIPRPSIPSIKAATVPASKLTSPGGLVGGGGYLNSGASLDRLSRPQFTPPLETIGVSPKKVLR